MQEAAALMESLASNHAFFDGNKRISFASTDTFLRLNGFYLEVNPVETEDFMKTNIANSTFKFNLIREWIESHMKSL